MGWIRRKLKDGNEIALLTELIWVVEQFGSGCKVYYSRDVNHGQMVFELADSVDGVMKGIRVYDPLPGGVTFVPGRPKE